MIYETCKKCHQTMEGIYAGLRVLCFDCKMEKARQVFNFARKKGFRFEIEEGGLAIFYPNCGDRRDDSLDCSIERYRQDFIYLLEEDNQRRENP